MFKTFLDIFFIIIKKKLKEKKDMRPEYALICPLNENILLLK